MWTSCRTLALRLQFRYLCFTFVPVIMAKAKPFIKWVGGKSQLISQLEPLLPADFDQKRDVTYIEPFVGGGAMLFNMLQAHDNISRAVINDINPDLTVCYETVRDRPDELVRSLASIQEDYYSVENEEAKKAYYLRMRDRFNAKPADPVEMHYADAMNTNSFNCL